MKKLITITLMIFAFVVMWQGCTKPEEMGSVYGTVTDYATGEPIKNANVKLKPTGTTTLTGSDGTYQFDNVANGKYSLFLSKNGYSDLDDDYEIAVANGNNVRRDVQLRSLFKSVQILSDGVEISVLDFGADPSIVRKTLTIFNNGTSDLTAEFTTSGNWMSFTTSVCDNCSSASLSIPQGSGKQLIVNVKRDNLVQGENHGYINISSGDYLKTLVVKAIGLSTPVLSNFSLTNVIQHSCEAQCSIVNDGGWSISDKGFEYRLYSTDNPSSVSCGPGNNNFQAQIPVGFLEPQSQVRAYATNGIYTAYSGWIAINDNPYFNLPTFTYGGQVYRVAPAAANTYTRAEAIDYCDNLTLYGYTDWQLPSFDELKIMWQNRNSIGGFGTGDWLSITQCYSNRGYYIRFRNNNDSYNGTAGCDNLLFKVRPVRVEN